LWSDQFIHGTILQEIAPINENRSEVYMDYFTFPRMSALAEVIWTKQSLRNWEGFEQRMQTQYNRYDQAGYGYRVPQPKLIKKEKTEDGFIIELESIVHDAEIRFTIDGVKPNIHSEIYTKPIEIGRLQDFQAITVVNRHHYSLSLYFPVAYPQFEKYGVMLGEWRTKDVLADQTLVLERNATGKIKKNGRYEVIFLHTDGYTQLEIEGISVYKNHNNFADDLHSGTAGDRAESNAYSFAVDNYETGAEFKIKANISGVGGNDSNGVIFIKMIE